MRTTATEVLGYLAAVVVVVSLAMTSVVRLRLLSLAGAVAFLAYGLLIGSYPIVLTNLAIAGVNLFHLRRELTHHFDLGYVHVPADSPFVTDFIRSHLTDIQTSQPDFQSAHLANFAVVLTRDGLPAGLIVGRREGSDLLVDLDYVLHAYRDSRLGTWVYGDGAGLFVDRGIRRVIARPATDYHRNYLVRVGFEAQPPMGPGVYTRALA